MGLVFKNKRQTRNTSDNNITIQNQNDNQVIIQNLFKINETLGEVRSNTSQSRQDINKLQDEIKAIKVRLRKLEMK